MRERIHMERGDVPAALLRAFPEYRGRKFVAVPCETVTVQGTYWSGGSRSTYRMVRLDGAGPVGQAPVDHPYFDGKGVEGQTYALPAGVAVVEHSIFCGKDMGLTFYVRPDVLAPLLPSGPELTDGERRALACFRGLKSGAYRQEALAGCGYSDEMRDRLAGLGLLKVAKNGATRLTTEGKNAAEVGR
jgi:hypothetical protein